MPEGLDPVEAGKKLHEHGHKSDNQAEETHETFQQRHSRIVQICEAALLALVTVTAAWTGYAAARWSTESRVDISRTSTLRDLATRNQLTAQTLRNFDTSTFNAWYIAFTLNDGEKQEVAIRRFRPEFRVAFDAWIATNPFQNPEAPPGPTYMPQYKLPAQEESNRLDKEANATFAEANHAGKVSDDYVRITVFLAAVLFLVGIGSSFQLLGVRYALITFGLALLILSVVLILRQPSLP